MDGTGVRSLSCSKMSPGLDGWRLEVQYSSIQRKLTHRYRSRSLYHKFKMGGRPDTSSYHVRGTKQKGVAHRYVYNGDCCNAEGSLNNKTLRGDGNHVKVARTSWGYPDEGPHDFECNGIRRIQLHYASKATRPLLSANSCANFQPSLNENDTGPRIIPSLELEKKSGMITGSSVGGKRLEELQKESENGGVARVDESFPIDDVKAIRAFKFVLVEHVRAVLRPCWKEGNLSRDAYKVVMKKAVNKIIGSIEASKVPRTKNDTYKYLSASKTKIFELIQAYVKKYQKG